MKLTKTEKSDLFWAILGSLSALVMSWCYFAAGVMIWWLTLLAAVLTGWNSFWVYVCIDRIKARRRAEREEAENPVKGDEINW